MDEFFNVKSTVTFLLFPHVETYLQILEKKLISDREYSLIKSRLMKDYKIVSDLLS